MSLSFEDKLAIHELTSCYALAMDESNLEAWLDTWSEEGVWEGGLGTYAGKDNLQRLLADLGERIKGKRHIMANFYITGGGTTAYQTCYLLIIEHAKLQNTVSSNLDYHINCKVVGTAVYQDKLEKIAGTWKFVHRRVQLDQSATSPP